MVEANNLMPLRLSLSLSQQLSVRVDAKAVMPFRFREAILLRLNPVHIPTRVLSASRDLGPDQKPASLIWISVFTRLDQFLPQGRGNNKRRRAHEGVLYGLLTLYKTMAHSQRHLGTTLRRHNRM